MAPGSSGPPKFDGRNYSYWKARMAGYLEALNPLAWEVTDKAMSVMDEDQTKWNARAKNAMFDAISQDIFARVHSKKTAHEVWKELENIHVGSKKLREKYQVLKEKLNEFKMHPSELVEQMYARLNVLVEDINALEISPLSSSDIIRKILHSLHKSKYNIVTSLLYEKDLSILRVKWLGKFALMRCFSWAKLILLKPKVILLSKLKANTSQTRRARARHLCQVQVKLVMTQVMRMVMKTPSLLSS